MVVILNGSVISVIIVLVELIPHKAMGGRILDVPLVQEENTRPLYQLRARIVGQTSTRIQEQRLALVVR